MTRQDPERLQQICDFPSLISYLATDLDWPVDSEDPDEITFDWEAGQLRVSDQTSLRFKHGVVKQLRPITPDQPWGIFIIEFTDDKILRTVLREVLRGLVPNQREKSDLPGWHHENLLFICTASDYRRITFVHFRGPKRQKARLVSFGWERDSTYLRTLCEFNLPQLRWPDDPTDTKEWRVQWASAFDKEPLTKEFFKRFEQALDWVKTDLSDFMKLPSSEAYSRAQLLLERLLFLYFLQNRGWLNQNRSFFIKLFEPFRDKPGEFSFYEHSLEKVFWSLASSPRSGGRFEYIPFLNGGLFDDDEFSPDPIRLKRNPPLKVRNDTFAQVFDSFLEAFNFTVREDTPLNQDVAVDPEMLGKVFESIVLHAEAADPEAIAPDKRKATGSYYTPRIVVHFICREALRQYLLTHLTGGGWPARLEVVFKVDATDGLDAEEITQLRSAFKPGDGTRLLDLLTGIKACDPAVGSGAFPVGLLHELVNLRRVAQTIANGFVDPVRRGGTMWIHNTKAEIIENCLYGVDIQQQAIEICRLRLWLSLIVDYDIGLDPFAVEKFQFRQAVQRISQLPNLEMNFRRGDSLLDQISDVPIQVDPTLLSLFDREVEKIHKLGRKLHRAKRAERKRKLRVEILRGRLELSEKVIKQGIQGLKQHPDKARLNLFGETASETQKRNRIEKEIGLLQEALHKIVTDHRALEKIAARPMDSTFYPKLRKLEGADFDSPFNFVWQVDFADIFSNRADGSEITIDGEFGFVNQAMVQQTLKGRTKRTGGFDLILGNPPFVTARNPKKREQYRERWKRVCRGKYLLVCPFFDQSFNLLRPGGQLGFIVSNAFAKREFGKPLIEDFFPTVDLQKVVDCSGLMFPGHGTPTCVVFGRKLTPDSKSSIRITAILPGGGDLRTPPERSPLWHTIETHHDNPGYADSRITVADRPRKEMAKWPWNLEIGASSSVKILTTMNGNTLREFLGGDIGFDAITAANEIYGQSADFYRRNNIPADAILEMVNGDNLRNFTTCLSLYLLWPYDESGKPSLQRNVKTLLKPWKSSLENRSQFHKTQLEAGLKWFEYREYHQKGCHPPSIGFSEIATHSHFVLLKYPVAFVQTAPVIKLLHSADQIDHHLLAGLLNSSTALFWLKQVCFNKGAGADEERDRFVFAGGKVQKLPVPGPVVEALRGQSNELTNVLAKLSEQCWERGRQLPALAMKKLFEKSREAYHDWNSSLAGYIDPDLRLGNPFQSTDDLQKAFNQAMTIREQLRAEMIGLQEEMDWIAYIMYGLLPAQANVSSQSADLVGSDVGLAREQRPFMLWNQTKGDFEKAITLIPSDWSDDRKKLWRKRLKSIRDNEHIRRIEQPVYKRRWDEQWKVGNRWQCGEQAYNAELVDAFYWWLSEKAEWWLESKKSGDPVPLHEWTQAVWQDSRVQAAWPVVSAALDRLGRTTDFPHYFANLVKRQSVPDNIPIAVPWNELEKKRKIPAAVKRIRGKLNVPRERFQITAGGTYVWAGTKVKP